MGVLDGLIYEGLATVSLTPSRHQKVSGGAIATCLDQWQRRWQTQLDHDGQINEGADSLKRGAEHEKHRRHRRNDSERECHKTTDA